jgi:hypothetical protein
VVGAEVEGLVCFEGAVQMYVRLNRPLKRRIKERMWFKNSQSSFNKVVGKYTSMKAEFSKLTKPALN